MIKANKITRHRINERHANYDPEFFYHLPIEISMIFTRKY